MKNTTISYVLVSLFFVAFATTMPVENKVLTGTIQFPAGLQVPISPLTIVYRGDPTHTQVDQKNHAISFQLLRNDSQYSFKLFIAEPQNIEYVPYESKYHTGLNTFKFQRIKDNSSYRYFVLSLIPSIVEGTKQIQYNWQINEERIRTAERKIPDDAIILHAAPEWISHLDGQHGFDFPTIWIKHNIVELAGSPEKLKDRFMRIALASMDSGALRGEKVEVAQKRNGNRIIHAALPTPAA